MCRAAASGHAAALSLVFRAPHGCSMTAFGLPLLRAAATAGSVPSVSMLLEQGAGAYAEELLMTADGYMPSEVTLLLATHTMCAAM